MAAGPARPRAIWSAATLATLLALLGIYVWAVSGGESHETPPQPSRLGSSAEAAETVPVTALIKEESGRAAAFAVVRIAAPALWPPLEQTANKEGVARFSAVPVGTLVVQAMTGKSVALEQVNALANQSARVELIARRGRIVRGRIVDADGVAVGGAHVSLSMGSGHALPLRAISFPDGSFRLGPAPVDSLTLAVWAPDFVPRAIPVAVRSDAVVNVGLQRAALISGLVVDSQGEPVVGAQVRVVPGDAVRGAGVPLHLGASIAADRGGAPWLSGELGVVPGPVPPIPTRLDAVLGEAPSTGKPSGISGTDGGFTLNTVPPGRLRLVARHPDYVEELSPWLTIHPGEDASLTLVLGDGGSAGGVVLTGERKPAEGMRVVLVAEDGLLLKDQTTAGDGRFQFKGVPGTSELLVFGRLGKLRLRKPLSVAAGAQMDLELTLPAVRGSSKVVVHGAEGEPVPGASVLAVPDTRATEAEPLGAEGSPEWIERRGITGADGEVLLSEIQGLRVRITVSAPNFATQSLTFSEAPELTEVTLQRGVVVEGSVTAVRGRQDVSGAQVTLVQGNTTSTAVTDGGGTYRLKGARPGAAEIWVQHSDYIRAVVAISVESESGGSGGFTVPAVDLARGGKISGTVTNALGEGVPGAAVAAGQSSTTTDTSGRYVLGQLPSGTLRLSASLPGGGLGRVEVTLQDGGEKSDVEIRLTKTPSEDPRNRGLAPDPPEQGSPEPESGPSSAGEEEFRGAVAVPGSSRPSANPSGADSGPGTREAEPKNEPTASNQDADSGSEGSGAMVEPRTP